MTVPKRIQQRRTKGWRKPDNTVSVARPGRWGNPYEVGIYGLELSLTLFRNTARGVWNPSVLDQQLSDEFWGATYRRHQDWLRRIAGRPVELARAELRGKNLMCFCPLDQPCHADVLLELANEEA